MASPSAPSFGINSDPDVDASDEYRQSILELAHKYSGSKIAWDVSQQVLDRLWNDENAIASNDPKGRGTSSASTTPITYVCQGCGVRLHPGWAGTTLRVQRPGPFKTPAAKKTARRRQLRKRRARALAEERNRTSRRQSRAPAATDSPASTAPRLVILRDDPEVGPLDRNRLVLTCGMCRHKTYLKGLRRSLLKPAPPPQRASHKGKAASVSTVPRTIGGVANLSENFERLPDLSNKSDNHKKHKPAAGIKKAPPTSMTLLEQKMGRKKKKKKPPPKGGGSLMNFLSSLNDH